MATASFEIKTHVFLGQHIRHFARGNRHRDEDAQLLEAKQYIPLNNSNPQDGDFTIIGACATSFPKEVYEALWKELISQCSAQGLRIRSIWCVDRSDHAASAIVNEEMLGDDQSDYDLARDLLHMVNVYRDDFITPVIGFGHSKGGTTLLELSRLHPRLFAGLILIDPIVGPEVFKIGVPLLMSAVQRSDLWGSREEAERALKAPKGMKRWHPKALQAYVDFGLRATPTRLYPEPGKFTLSTSKANESFAYARPFFEPAAMDGEIPTERGLAKYPDLDYETLKGFPFYRSEALTVWNELPALRPSVLYIVPQYGPFSAPKVLESILARTGTGGGGSGGRKMGRVQHKLLKGQTHLLPFEAPAVCAEVVAKYMVEELQAWARRREISKADADGKSIDYIALSDEWKKQAKIWYGQHGPKPKPKAKI